MTTEHVTFTLTIDSGDDVVVDMPFARVPDLLDDVAARLRRCRTSGSILDVNGNTVGQWELAQTVVRWEHDPSHDGAGCSWCGDFAQVNDEYLCRTCYADGTER